MGSQNKIISSLMIINKWGVFSLVFLFFLCELFALQLWISLILKNGLVPDFNNGLVPDFKNGLVQDTFWYNVYI